MFLLYEFYHDNHVISSPVIFYYLAFLDCGFRKYIIKVEVLRKLGCGYTEDSNLDLTVKRRLIESNLSIKMPGSRPYVSAKHHIGRDYFIVQENTYHGLNRNGKIS